MKAIWVLHFLAMALATSMPTPLQAADAPRPTLAAECGKPGSFGSMGADQYNAQCQAGYLARGAWVKSDASLRANAMAAISCAISCVGGSTLCSDGSVRPCQQMKESAKRALRSDEGSRDARSQMREATSNAATLRQGQVANVKSDPTWKFESGLSSSCEGLAGGGTGSGVTQRYLKCAMDSDPGLPSFVRNPKFQADLERVTGLSMDSVISAPTATFIGSAIPTGIRNVYNHLSKKMGAKEFLKKGHEALMAVARDLPEDRQAHLIDGVVPAGLRDRFPTFKAPFKANDQKNSVESGNSLASNASGIEEASKQTPLGKAEALPKALPETLNEDFSAVIRSPAEVAVASGSQAGEEENPAISIFDRVHRRYQAAAVSNRVLDPEFISD